MDTEEKPTAAFAVSLIGGILGLLGGIWLAIVGAAVTFWIGGIGAALGMYMVIMNLIIIIGAIMIYQKPSTTRTWGIVILIISIIGFFNIIALIGGILAMVWKPTAPVTGLTPAISRICPQCGRVIDKDIKFCPHCGKKLE